MDTSIIIDLYRGCPPAAAWVQHNAGLRLGVASVVWMECVYGADNRHRQRQLIDLLSRFSITLLTDDDQTWAMRQLAVYRLS